MILNHYYPLLDRQPTRQSPVHPQHSEVISWSQSPMSCTEPESLRDDQSKSASRGADADGRKEEQVETVFTVQPYDMTGKHRDGEQNPPGRAQVSEEEGEVVFKCECLALKPLSACEEMEGPGEPHPVTQQTTTVDGVLHDNCAKSQDRGGNFFFQAEVGMELETSQVAALHFVKLAVFE